jgi:hypothetical protein
MISSGETKESINNYRRRTRYENRVTDTKLQGFLRHNRTEPYNNHQHTIRTKRRPTETKPTAAPACLVRSLKGLRCAVDPARTHTGSVEASSSGKHAGQVATLHHRQLAVHIGEAGVTLVLGVGKGGVGGFAEELHCAGAKAPQMTPGHDSLQINE